MARPKSKKPKKQRKYEKTAALHDRRKMLSSHLSPELKKQYGKRAFPVKKGDEVIVMRGKYKKQTGKVMRVDKMKYRVYVEGAMIKKTDGTERQASIHPSNLKITKLNLEDKKRVAALQRGK
jgi:large subunit ribosomal protein L24